MSARTTLAMPTLGLLLLLAGAAPADDPPSPAAPAAHAPSARELIERVREGGYVIYFRHALTDHAQIDKDREKLDNCATQRNLSKEGREQAREIGSAMERLGVPVGEVLSSPYCRALDTANLAFGRSEVRKELRFGMGADTKETAWLASKLRDLLSKPPEAGSNRILVSHSSNLKEAARVWPRHEGGAYIFHPLERNGFLYVGEIAPGEWGDVALP